MNNDRRKTVLRPVAGKAASRTSGPQRALPRAPTSAAQRAMQLLTADPATLSADARLLTELLLQAGAVLDLLHVGTVRGHPDRALAALAAQESSRYQQLADAAVSGQSRAELMCASRLCAWVFDGVVSQGLSEELADEIHLHGTQASDQARDFHLTQLSELKSGLLFLPMSWHEHRTHGSGPRWTTAEHGTQA